jgi:hypothetical protein
VLPAYDPKRHVGETPLHACCDLQSWVIGIGRTNQDLVVRVILAAEAFEIGFELVVESPHGFQNAYRR